MEDHTYRRIELVGSSKTSIEDAIENALSRAGKALRHLDWFEVMETRGHIGKDNKVAHYQVVLKVGFRIED
ncbi:MAG: dodecin [Alphaproteobacteria bacterium]